MKLDIILEDENISPNIYIEGDRVVRITIEAPKIEIDKIVNEGANDVRETEIRINSVHKCPRCEVERPLDHFYKNTRASYGVERYCILCRKEIQKEYGKKRAAKKRRNKR
jgi:superfamily II helicase